MSSDFIDSLVEDEDYRIALNAIDYYINVSEDYEHIADYKCAREDIYEDYLNFRLIRDKHFQSEGREVVRETYKVLGYNPFNPKQK